MVRRSLLAFLLVTSSSIGCGSRVDVFRDDGGPSDTGADTGPTSDTGGVDTGIEAGTCSPYECGPAPGIPSEKCWDGSYSGASCMRGADGKCGWVFTSCPSSKCDSSAACAPKGYCDTPVGVCGGSGECTLKPDSCGKDYSPTCGCDGVTYGNPCMAAKAGVVVEHTGPCEMPPPPTKVCGGFGGATCSSTEWCDYTGTGSNACGFADGGGTCKPRPAACDGIYKPVCGCDYKTYSNECQAQMQGLDIQYDGACK